MESQVHKSCCARFYEKEEFRLLLGDYWHPGGPDLTLELGRTLQLRPGHLVLDIASGLGSTGALLASKFQCSITDVDLSGSILSAARTRLKDFSEKVSFCRSDGEYLPFHDATFNAIFCECSLCMFPSRETAAKEMFRVLNPNGQAAISDMTVQAQLSNRLQSILYDFLCIKEAGPLNEYLNLLTRAGFVDIRADDKSEALLILLDNVRKAFFAVELLVGLKKLDVSADSLNRAKELLSEITTAAKEGAIGYVALIASKP